MIELYKCVEFCLKMVSWEGRMNNSNKERQQILQALKEKVFQGAEAAVPPEYQALAEEWKRSARLGVPFYSETLTDQIGRASCRERVF